MKVLVKVGGQYGKTQTEHFEDVDGFERKNKILQIMKDERIVAMFRNWDYAREI